MIFFHLQVRVSVGLEDVDDLVKDLEQALEVRNTHVVLLMHFICSCVLLSLSFIYFTQTDSHMRTHAVIETHTHANINTHT